MRACCRAEARVQAVTTEAAKARAAKRRDLHQEIHACIVAAKEVPCARCCKRYPTVCMDFDHLPEFEKSFNIGSPSNWTSVARIKAEMSKCQVVCSNCHRILTWERKYGRKVDEPARVSGPADRCADRGSTAVAGYVYGGQAYGSTGNPFLRRVASKRFWQNLLTAVHAWDRV